MSKIEVNEIDKQSGSTLTLGGSGTAVTLACGATQTGFGRTGTVDWQTGSIKTTTFTAASGEGYFANTSSGGFSMNLPAGTGGSIVSVADYTNTFQTGNLTIVPNGSQKIGGQAINVILSTEGQSVTLVYVDDTEGWITVNDSSENVVGNDFITATGGTETTCGNCKIHTFTGPGTFAVSTISTNCAARNVVSYLVVAGGGGAGSGSGGGGGGGGGGYREVVSPSAPYTGSPLQGYPNSPNRVTVTSTNFPITVGGGGTGSPATSPDISGNNTSGGNSTFSTITSAGGGFGGSGPACSGVGSAGGSGGGGRYAGNGGAGNTPPTTPAQGFAGGNSSSSGRRGGGGGGGASEAGVAGEPGSQGRGGAGTPTQISGSAVAFSGGGGGAGWPGGSPPMPSGPQSNGSPCGTGGTGAGHPTAGGDGTTNRGGGGGANGNPGSAPTAVAGNGGSGLVVIRYKFQ